MNPTMKKMFSKQTYVEEWKRIAPRGPDVLRAVVIGSVNGINESIGMSSEEKVETIRNILHAYDIVMSDVMNVRPRLYTQEEYHGKEEKDS